MRIVVAVIFATMLVACSSGLDQKIDGSTEKTFESSLAQMKKSAKAEDVLRLDEALLVLAISNVSIGFEGGILGAIKKISATKLPEQLADRLMPVVDGLTGREIIKAGATRKRVEATKQMGSIEFEIEKLFAKREEYATTKGILAPIKVSEPTLRFSSVGAQKMSVIACTITNGSAVGLTYLYLRGTVVDGTTGKTLFADDINYKLSAAPLLQGESKSLRLPNSAPGKWNDTEIWGKENLRLTIELVNAENLAGQKLAATFTQKDRVQLAALEASKQALAEILRE